MSNQEIVQRVEQRKKEHNRDGYGQQGGHWRDVSFLLDEGRRDMQPGAGCDNRGHNQYLGVAPD